MCRSTSEGGRRCPGSSRAGSNPPADGKTRIEVHTSKRSYSVIGGDSRVAWLPGEKVVSMDVIDPSPAAGGTAADDEERYLRRIEQLERTPDVGALMTGEKFDRDADAAAAAAARIKAEFAGDEEQWQQSAPEERRGWL